MRDRALPLLVTALLMLASAGVYAQDGSIVKFDNGTVQSAHNAPGMEESVILEPDGPCTVTAIQIYFFLDRPASDTLWIVGDPSEGALPPTSWCWSYNTLVPPIIIDYDGNAGWKEYDVSHLGIRSEGHDRIVLQHRIDQDGLLFAFDSDGLSSPSRSFLMDPSQLNSLGFPGRYYLAGGDFMVRLVVEYDYPDEDGSQPQPTPSMVDVTEEAGLTVDGNAVTSSRVSVADWNGDGWDDIAAGSRFWQNNGDGTFTKVDLGISASTTVWGDYDNDGDLDCYGARGGQNEDRLYRNNGDGTFTNVFDETGITNQKPTVTPIWFDFDHDGNLDIYISNGRTGDGAGGEIYYQDALWINNGDGTFYNVTDAVGISQVEFGANFDCWGAAATDYNGDSWTDIFVATYRLGPDQLYRNNMGQSMTDVGQQSGVRGETTNEPTYFGHGIGAEWADYNNDGMVDVAVGNLGHPDYRAQFSNPSLIYRNDGGSPITFTEVHKNLGVKFYEMNAGVVWGDFNLDGFQDLFHCQYAYNNEGENGEPARLSRLYFNQGPNEDWKLLDRTWHTGLTIHGAWTACRLDFDRDGDLDLVIASPKDRLALYENRLGWSGNAVSFRLVGSPDNDVSLDGYGTRLVAYAGDKMLYRDLQGGGGGATGSQNSNALHFGIGKVNELDSLEVKWPDGLKTTYTNVPANREYIIEYGADLPQETRTLTVDGVGSATRGEETFSVLSADVRDNVLQAALNGIVRGTVDIALFDVNGRQLSKGRADVGASGISWPISVHLANGVYIVRVSDGRTVSTAKFVVQ